MSCFKSVYEALDFAFNYTTHRASNSLGLARAQRMAQQIIDTLRVGLTMLQQCALVLRFDLQQERCQCCGQAMRSMPARHAEFVFERATPRLRAQAEREAIRQAAVMLQPLRILPEVCHAE